MRDSQALLVQCVKTPSDKLFLLLGMLSYYWLLAVAQMALNHFQGSPAFVGVATKGCVVVVNLGIPLCAPGNDPPPSRVTNIGLLTFISHELLPGYSSTTN